MSYPKVRVESRWLGGKLKYYIYIKNRWNTSWNLYGEGGDCLRNSIQLAKNILSEKSRRIQEAKQKNEIVWISGQEWIDF